jgi:serine/threonine-protein kinase RsbT
LTATRIKIATPEQVVVARKAVQERAVVLGFGTLERTKLVTAVSELARNTLVHGGGGDMTILEVQGNGRVGLQVDFEDKGPGIAEISQAMRDGFTTANSLGLGLGGAKRLVTEFAITSSPGAGTHVRIVQWKRR